MIHRGLEVGVPQDRLNVFRVNAHLIRVCCQPAAESVPYLHTGMLHEVFEVFRKEVLALDPSVTEESLKLHVARKSETNFVRRWRSRTRFAAVSVSATPGWSRAGILVCEEASTLLWLSSVSRRRSDSYSIGQWGIAASIAAMRRRVS